MSKKRELLKECYFYIDNKIDASPKALLIRIQELLAQPEQPERWSDLNRQQVYEKGWRAGYEEKLLTQPENKREPMTGKEISQGFQADKDATNAESYWAGVALAENHYGAKKK